ncbi:GNAT family N-acetyltransferase [Roseateles sp. DAIF2]|uniref:GNAT family N-acetyltransferase n=1 Tax=Roseateles sp. DAIF2 TaxID=2714952 RepID=UPI0018A25989|nr:GNAT family N-acetyltransferase [Roseateles sp. DAIF2]QPF75491.1 GNAT family N-acetyltransferase [Roseateles sp. DAIF2]
MTAPTIVTATEDEAEQVCARLRAFNRARRPDLAFEPLWLCARDGLALIGGLVGEVYLGWLELQILWVDETRRGQGLGAALLRAGEQRARELGARYAYLDTFGWQAEAFYARQGYAPFGRLEDFPLGSARVFMRKTLAA